MSGCEGCFQSVKGIQEAFSVIRVKAKAEANEKGYSIAIVWENDEWKFYNAFFAVQSGFGPLIKEVVSHD